jgi:hypothetical protein
MNESFPLEKKLVNYTVRITPDEKKRLDKLSRECGIKATWMVHACLQAACDYYEKHGEMSFPLVVVPRSRWEKQLKLLKPTLAAKATP